MTDPTPTDTTDGFAARVQQLHVPEPKADREALLLKVGVGLVVVGVVLIVVAWFQASGTASVAEQVPYVVSGGLVGLALVIVGSALVIRFSLARLFRYWLARIVYEHQVQTDRTVDVLARIEALLGGGEAGHHAAPGAPAATADRPSGDHADPPPVRRTEPLRAEPLEG
ncbi:hypothetical protein PO878_16755 [Iamia majanohamensis]|uniref:Uncharacterized protein n=1 Tax=Iamia majanohamensis TaxID=467976 RepID=A0AAE9Y815_9ACTN|nr:hypothetical protein [Iamia majanohamensis]WCO66153.1 hypothetical protein PO878_16755 [Iamia majanohamensis]